jgi:hypothetical protein
MVLRARTSARTSPASRVETAAWARSTDLAGHVQRAARHADGLPVEGELPVGGHGLGHRLHDLRAEVLEGDVGAEAGDADGAAVDGVAEALQQGLLEFGGQVGGVLGVGDGVAAVRKQVAHVLVERDGAAAQGPLADAVLGRPAVLNEVLVGGAAGVDGGLDRPLGAVEVVREEDGGVEEGLGMDDVLVGQRRPVAGDLDVVVVGEGPAEGVDEGQAGLAVGGRLGWRGGGRGLVRGGGGGGACGLGLDPPDDGPRRAGREPVALGAGASGQGQARRQARADGRRDGPPLRGAPWTRTPVHGTGSLPNPDGSSLIPGVSALCGPSL